MNGSTRRRSRRRLIKAGIAASAAVAAAGAIFVSQAGAAQVTDREVFIKVAPEIQCAYVVDRVPSNGVVRAFKKLDYKALNWQQGQYNDTGIKARVGDQLNLSVSPTCSQSDGYTLQPVHVSPTGGSTSDLMVDTTTLPRIS